MASFDATVNRRPRLIIMVKAPVAGRVKTRLGREIGMERAAWWYRHQTARLLRRLGGDPRWQTVLAIAPDTALEAALWPHGILRTPQGRGDLGERMARLLTLPHAGPALLIGSDIPGVTPGHIQRAFGLLRGRDALFAPAHDGGYWAVGLRHPARAPGGFLKDVRWSSPHTLADSLATLGPLRPALGEVLRDVDGAADLTAIKEARV
ncbi:TIGR04282 family arsenosugar biosynthesis glycosyltransferase [Rhodalgimonas zhirmunskyi]|uniref:Glycosyltransferase n=1 Tax=Rhodalgimonas zhirmunskyi TaxID=2964767 RepID=A0AAJ1U934_9RHOB|nr:glycosyltransferase [Rhodoalgimonas zhirmunskyi]MDQ2095860.1 glycosyltransferase [Rhodoalgimonas zhirmunskyi]